MQGPLEKWWKANRWWLQIATFALTSAVAAGMVMQSVYAYGPRIDELEKSDKSTNARLSRIEQGVDDIKFFWHIPGRGR